MSGLSTYEDERRAARPPATSPPVTRPPWGRWMLRGTGIVVWGVVSFALTFAELVAEVVAPLLLMLGGLWWAALQVIPGLPLPPEMKPLLDSFPRQLVAGGHVLAPTGLLAMGLWLLALVAACRTLNAIIFKQT